MPFILHGISEVCLLSAGFAMHVPLFLQGKDHTIPCSLRHSAAQTSERCNVGEGDAQKAVWAQTRLRATALHRDKDYRCVFVLTLAMNVLLMQQRGRKALV